MCALSMFRCFFSRLYKHITHINWHSVYPIMDEVLLFFAKFFTQFSPFLDEWWYGARCFFWKALLSRWSIIIIVYDYVATCTFFFEFKLNNMDLCIHDTCIEFLIRRHYSYSFFSLNFIWESKSHRNGAFLWCLCLNEENNLMIAFLVCRLFNVI